MLNNDRHLHFLPLGMHSYAPDEDVSAARYVEPAPLAKASDYDTFVAAIAEVEEGAASGILCSDTAAKAVNTCFSKLRSIEESAKGALFSIPAGIAGIMLISGEPALRLGLITTRQFWKLMFSRGGTALTLKAAQDIYVTRAKISNARELPYGRLCLSLWWHRWAVSDNFVDTLVIAPCGARLPLSRKPA